MGEVFVSTGVWFIMNPKSSGNYHGFTGRNEHGDPHVEVYFQGNKADLFLKTKHFEVITGKIHPRMKKAAKVLLSKYTDELLKMWETGNIYLIVNDFDHR